MKALALILAMASAAQAQNLAVGAVAVEGEVFADSHFTGGCLQRGTGWAVAHHVEVRGGVRLKDGGQGAQRGEGVLAGGEAADRDQPQGFAGLPGSGARQGGQVALA